ncbi:MAG: hypothetical protein SVV67_10185 [Bacillota bacterium]|nr:hypothetical protein [Bacillota bacterium]
MGVIFAPSKQEITIGRSSFAFGIFLRKTRRITVGIKKRAVAVAMMNPAIARGGHDAGSKKAPPAMANQAAQVVRNTINYSTAYQAGS